MNQTDDSNELRNHSGAGVRGELRNLETGIRNGWNIPVEILTAVPQRMLEFIQTGSRREAISAARVLVAMSRSTQPNIQAHLHQHQTAPAVGVETEATSDDDFDLERERQKNFERIDRLRRFGALDD